jgi:hypothetical protein
VFTAPHVLTGSEALLLTAVAAVFGAFLAARLKRWPTRTTRAVAAIAGALAATSLAAAPTTAWSIVSDARAAHRLSTRDAERLGVEENGVDTTLTDRAAAIIPERETFALVFGSGVSVDRALVFRLWSLGALLPRIALSDRRSADWIVSWGVAPSALGVRVTDVHVVRARRGPGPPLYVSRVER